MASPITRSGADTRVCRLDNRVEALVRMCTQPAHDNRIRLLSWASAPQYLAGTVHRFIEKDSRAESSSPSMPCCRSESCGTRHGNMRTPSRALRATLTALPVCRAMKGMAGGHAAHRKKVQLLRLAAQFHVCFAPVHLCFLAPVLTLRHEHFGCAQAQLPLLLPHVAPHLRF